MMKDWILKAGIVMMIFGYWLFSYMEKQNQLTKLKITIPALAAEVTSITEENARCQYEIDRFENPSTIIGFLAQPEYAGLKHPLVDEIFSMQTGLAIRDVIEGGGLDAKKSVIHVAVGAK